MPDGTTSNTATDRKEHCPAREKTCDSCSILGHLKNMCQSAKGQKPKPSPQKVRGAGTTEKKPPSEYGDWMDHRPDEDDLESGGAMTLKTTSYAAVASGRAKGTPWTDAEIPSEERLTMGGAGLKSGEKPKGKPTWTNAEQWEDPGDLYYEADNDHNSCEEEPETNWKNAKGTRKWARKQDGKQHEKRDSLSLEWYEQVSDQEEITKQESDYPPPANRARKAN